MKLKQIYKHDLALTQIGETLWPEVQERMREIFNLMPNANPMHIRQMITSALMMESAKRITKAKREKSKGILITRQRDASRILSPQISGVLVPEA